MTPAAAYLWSLDVGRFMPQRRAVEEYSRDHGFDVRFWFVDPNGSQKDRKRLILYGRLGSFRAVLVTDPRAKDLFGSLFDKYHLELVHVPTKWIAG